MLDSDQEVLGRETLHPQVASGHSFITRGGKPGTGGQAAQMTGEAYYTVNRAELLSFLHVWAPGGEMRVGAENWDNGL